MLSQQHTWGVRPWQASPLWTPTSWTRVWPLLTQGRIHVGRASAFQTRLCVRSTVTPAKPPLSQCHTAAE